MDGTNNLAEREAALKARRARICAYTDRVLEAVEGMDMPETIEEAGRTTRLMAGLDRLYVRLFSEPRLTLYNNGASAARRTPEPPPKPEKVYTPEEDAALREKLAKKLTRAVNASRAARGLPLDGPIDKETYLKADREYAERSGNGAHYKPPIWFPGDPWPKEWQAKDPQGEYQAEAEDDPAPPGPPPPPPTDPREAQAQAIFDAYLEAIKSPPSTDSGGRQDTGPP